MAKRIRSSSDLTGPEKAALFLLVLGEERSAPIVSRMGDEELVGVAGAMAGLGTMARSDVEGVIAEFVERMGSSDEIAGTVATTERILRRSLPKERVDALMEELRGPAGRTIWEKLGNVPASVLANYLKNEYPQTVAVVLSRLSPEKAAEVMALLPEAFALEGMLRMLRMEAVGKEVLESVESVLKVEFMAALGRSGRGDMHERMAEIMNGMDAHSRERMLSGLDERNRESAERVRRLMFTFEDLVRIDSDGIRRMTKDIPRAQLIAALKGAPRPIVDLFKNSMSERGWRIVADEIASSAPLRRAAVEEARSSIVLLAKELAAKKELAISDGAEDEGWVS